MSRADLYRLFAQQVLRQTEYTKELTVQIVAVGNDDNGRVFHCGFLHYPRSKAGHGDALAAALRVPDHTAFLVTAGARCFHHLRDGCTHRMELVIARDLLDQRAVVFKQHEVTQVVQQVLRSQHAAHQRL